MLYCVVKMLVITSNFKDEETRENWNRKEFLEEVKTEQDLERLAWSFRNRLDIYEYQGGNSVYYWDIGINFWYELKKKKQSCIKANYGWFWKSKELTISNCCSNTTPTTTTWTPFIKWDFDGISLSVTCRINCTLNEKKSDSHSTGIVE